MEGTSRNRRMLEHRAAEREPHALPAGAKQQPEEPAFAHPAGLESLLKAGTRGKERDRTLQGALESCPHSPWRARHWAAQPWPGPGSAWSLSNIGSGTRAGAADDAGKAGRIALNLLRIDLPAGSIGTAQVVRGASRRTLAAAFTAYSRGDDCARYRPATS